MASAEDISYLIELLSFWEIWAYAAIAAVAVGVLGEVIHDFTAWFKRSIWWADKGNKYSAILLVVALFAEFGIQIKENSVSGRIIAAQQRETAAARERTAVLQNETSMLRNAVESRRLTDEQKTQLASALNGHDVPNFLICVAQDFEAMSYAWDITKTLGAIGMKERRIQMLEGAPPMQPGVVVFGEKADRDGLLVKALLDTHVAFIGIAEALPGMRIRECMPPLIFIGVKPPLRFVPIGE
jgi:hypothetical protein